MGCRLLSTMDAPGIFYSNAGAKPVRSCSPAKKRNFPPRPTSTPSMQIGQNIHFWCNRSPCWGAAYCNVQPMLGQEWPQCPYGHCGHSWPSIGCTLQYAAPQHGERLHQKWIFCPICILGVEVGRGGKFLFFAGLQERTGFAPALE